MLHVTARAMESNIISLLLDHFSAIKNMHLLDAKDSARHTPLHHACRSGKSESVMLLLEAGANPDVEDYAGLIPLHACAEF
jgi:ankyrin repeat protein